MAGYTVAYVELWQPRQVLSIVEHSITVAARMQIGLTVGLERLFHFS